MSENTIIPDDTGITGDLESLIQYDRATTGQRFLNWLIDNILMRFGLIYLTNYVVVFLLQTLAPEYLFRLAYEQDTWDLFLINYMIAIFNYLFYYTICEKAFKGYTLGKLITGTRAVRQDGSELTFKDAIYRSLARLVPFEAFSGFGTPWHDSWTKTTVIKTR